MRNQTPFLEARSFVQDEVSLAEAESPLHPASPFLTVYEREPGVMADPAVEEYVVFLNELYDDELEESLFTLTSEAAALYEARFTHEQGGGWSDDADAERLLQQHFAPLFREADAMLDAIAQELRHRDVRTLTSHEIDAVVEGYVPSESLSPEFDEFLGKLRNTVKKVAGKAADLAKKGAGAVAKVGLAPVLEKLKALVRPLLQRVLRTAIGRLPAPLQPVARRLADRLPQILGETHEVARLAAGRHGHETSEPHGHELHAGESCEIARIQYEFNHRVANLLLAADEVEQELELARAVTDPVDGGPSPIAGLDVARDRFIDGLRNLREGEDPTPLVEEFVPAILPALHVGIRLIGRQRVVNFLAGLLAQLIGRFVGPQHSPMLSQAIVDAGLRLLSLEATEDAGRAAASAVAATVEETVRRVADLPDHVLEDRELFEGFALRAFEAAAAANLPAVLPESTYRKRPDLAEARRLRGTWMMMPAAGRKRYKKFTRTVRARLSPHSAAALESFEGIPLEEFLEEEMGIAPGEELEAVVHLYEALPGTHLPDIARLERNTPGLGTPQAYAQLHPLTREAASVLLGEPDLGRDVDAAYLADEHTTTVGQRFYFLEVAGRRPLSVPDATGRARPRQPTHARLALDFPRGEIRMRLFLSEIRTQEVAVKLRQRAHVGTVVARLQEHVERGLRTALSGGFARLKIVHEAVTPDQWVPAMRGLPSVVPQLLRNRLQEWVLQALAAHLRARAEEFVRAADDPADGVTIIITLVNPPGFPELRRALRGNGVSLAGLRLSGAPAEARVSVLPGHVDE
jgi:hypothetical protein